MHIDLVPVWTLILAVGVFMYVFLDGFDLGVGILFPLARDDASRTLMMNSVAPVWDGNETWLILGGTALMAAFPLAFSIIIPALYFPILLMLLGLIFRGVAFEFRLKAHTGRHWWDRSFFAGSLVATFFQGVVLGDYVQGFAVSGRHFAGGSFDWVKPLQARSRAQARACLFGVLAFIAMVSVWTPFLHPKITARWFTWPNMAYLAPVPIVTAGIAIALWRSLARGGEFVPFLATMGLFWMCYLGLAISVFPYVVPWTITLWDAASSPGSQAFLLVGTLVILPIVFMYTGWSYYVFRGKVRAELGYH
jgi:cytochrome bd ubiquinol oxidase subunit II